MKQIVVTNRPDVSARSENEAAEAAGRLLHARLLAEARLDVAGWAEIEGI